MTANTHETEPVIAVSRLAKSFGPRPVLDGVDLDLPAGTVTALTGPSGTGKTTLLRLIAGLDGADAGEIRIGGMLASSDTRLFLPPHARGIGMVFQQPALWPHMRVSDHVAFGLKDGADRGNIVADLLTRLGIAHLAEAYPAALSGGEAARVALARALAPSPRCLLLDEPLAHLQLSLRRELAASVGEIARATAAATLIVTHSPDDLAGIADRFCHLEAGKLVPIKTTA